MQIFLGADHRGFELKTQLLAWLKGLEGVTTTDCGNLVLDPADDFPDYTLEVARAVTSTAGSLGIFLCGSGAGATIALNKYPGVRASLGLGAGQVRAARNDDDLNVLVIAVNFTGLEEVKAMILALMETPFSGEERHLRRLAKITQLEKTHA